MAWLQVLLPGPGRAGHQVWPFLQQQPAWAHHMYSRLLLVTKRPPDLVSSRQGQQQGIIPLQEMLKYHL